MGMVTPSPEMINLPQNGLPFCLWRCHTPWLGDLELVEIHPVPVEAPADLSIMTDPPSGKSGEARLMPGTGPSRRGGDVRFHGMDPAP